jgi:hypothetical protein
MGCNNSGSAAGFCRLIQFSLEGSDDFYRVNTAGERFSESATHNALHLSLKAVQKPHKNPPALGI